MMLAEASHD